MQKELTVLFAFAVFVLVLGWAVTPAQAHHCKGRHFFDGCDAGGGPTQGVVKATSLEIDFDDNVSGANLLSDDGLYIDKEGVNASADKLGHITMLLGKGNNDRQVELNISCAAVVGINRCNELPMLDGGGNGLEGNFPEGGQVIVAVNPYKVNCPTTMLADGECPDVFTMSAANSELMGFRVSFSEGLFISVDSAIGGATASDPGRCLSLLTDTQRTAFLDAECSNEPPSECNVTVTATHVGDGKNDAWMVDADGVTALICQIGNPGDQFVIGKTTLTFEFNAVKKP